MYVALRANTSTIYWFDISSTPFNRSARGLINDHHLLSFALLASFKTLKTLALLHCFITLFFTHCVFLRTLHLPQSSPSSKHFRSSKGNVFISPTEIYCILIGLHHPLTILKHTLWVALFSVFMFFVFRFSITFSLYEPPLFMLFSSFQSNHSAYKPSSLPFLPSFQLFQWLVQETSQTHLCLPENFHQRLAESILHKTLPPLQPKLRDPHLLNPTNHSQLHHKLKNLWNPFMTTKNYILGPPQLCWVKLPPLTQNPPFCLSREVIRLTFRLAKDMTTRSPFTPVFLENPYATMAKGATVDHFFSPGQTSPSPHPLWKRAPN